MRLYYGRSRIKIRLAHILVAVYLVLLLLVLIYQVIR